MANKKKIEIELPETNQKGKPMVLIFAEPQAVEELKKTNLVFSEHSEGLVSPAAEDFESTQAGGNEGADTTWPV